MRGTDEKFIRNPAVTETALDDEVFLVEPASGEVFYLDAVTSGLWNLFAAPASLSEALAAFRDAFPDEPAAKVAGDIERAVADMRARELIVAIG